MQTEREPFEWLLLYVQWVAVNTLAWVAGWGFARVAVELTYSLELGAVVLLVAGSGLMLVGTRLLTNGVLYREGEPRDPIKVGGWAKLFFNIYTFLTGGLLAALIFGTFDLLKNDFYIEHFLLLAPVYIFGREIIVAKMDEKKMDGIWIIVIIGGILFLALTGNVIREVVETWQLSVKFVHSILLPGVENALWPAVFGLIMGVLPGLPLVGFLQRIPLDLVEINRKDREDLAKKKKGRKYELFYILIFVGMLASSAMQPCGWMKEIVSPSDCLNKFEVGGADIIAFSPDGKLLATGSGEIQ
ncbi:MAG: hypothetical protein OEZ02_07185, partial [Anaerolineae bacterium]|nr:hypothetical protein [Anaerolineae bacterium]